MRRRLATAAIAVTLLVAAGCGGNDNGATGSDGNGNGPTDSGEVTGPGGDDGGNDGERHTSVPAALTTEELCTEFQVDVIQPAAQAVGDAIADIRPAFESGDEARFQDSIDDAEATLAEYEKVLRDTASALTDNPDLSSAMDRFADSVAEYTDVFVTVVRAPDFELEADAPPEIRDAQQANRATGGEVRGHCD